ncbi:hypothetical protein [Enterobacter bugandensis]|uniref:hypothetical protein n=1 Tax=Enterobacter bugandensis TaxID=881260 RepID=UPI002074B2D0|nr:hypothetical protein [Enterobacter bugandensis]MCM7766238.1 hypothetical protein [Enterobacter bugandensis]
MSDNPFDKIISESLGNINKLSRLKSEFSKKLSLASESLNNALPGTFKLDLRLKLGNVTPSAAISAVMFTLRMSNEDSKGFVFLANQLTAEIVCSWEIDETSDTLSITCNKVKNTYPTTDEGITEAIVFLLSQKSVLEMAIRLKKEIVTR